jgi:hypothetical protein
MKYSRKLQRPQTEPWYILVSVGDGLIQSVSDIPKHLRVVVLDHDIEGADENELISWTSRGGTNEKAFVSLWSPGDCENLTSRELGQILAELKRKKLVE